MTTAPNPTAEQIVADAITAYWADEERSGPNRGPLAHDFACGEAAAAALRAHGLLSEGAPIVDLDALAERLRMIFWNVYDPDSSTYGNVQEVLDQAMPIIVESFSVGASSKEPCEGCGRGSDRCEGTVPSEEQIERVARELAHLEPGEDWPTNEELGGSLTGTRDDEYHDGMRERAREALAVAGVAQPSLDSEKVAEVLHYESGTRFVSGRWLDKASSERAARALCEAYKEGRLNA